jgi:xyloglucan-specific endo-beta-1,4-glucanase
MKTNILFAFLLLSVAGAALEPRQQASLCKKYEYWSGNGYECLNNLWGDEAATSGSQCTYVDGASSSGVKWHTKWTWNGGQNNVKSYAYCGKILTKGRTIGSINSMQTSTNWSYDVNTMRCNVAYDIFTAADPNHVNSSGDYELMIWLARIGDIYPIGKSTMQVTLAGHTWDLWTGYNGQMRVFSFVAPTPINNFSADVKEFFNWLEKNQDFPASKQNLIGESSPRNLPPTDIALVSNS